jgi:hypothetical protein
MSELFPKIYAPFKRSPETNKLIPGEWFRPEFEVLAELKWDWTEKIDGTNIRVIWDGHKVVIGGRTENAQLSADLIRVLAEMFPEEKLEQQFQDSPAILFGEGYGAGIRGGGVYRSDKGFALFDVKIGDWWLAPWSVAALADSMGIEGVPTLGQFSVAEAIYRVAEAGYQSLISDQPAEGLVGRAPVGLLDRSGKRIMMKVKRKDFV